MFCRSADKCEGVIFQVTRTIRRPRRAMLLGLCPPVCRAFEMQTDIDFC